MEALQHVSYDYDPTTQKIGQPKPNDQVLTVDLLKDRSHITKEQFNEIEKNIAYIADESWKNTDNEINTTTQDFLTKNNKEYDNDFKAFSADIKELLKEDIDNNASIFANDYFSLVKQLPVNVSVKNSGKYSNYHLNTEMQTTMSMLKLMEKNNVLHKLTSDQAEELARLTTGKLNEMKSDLQLLTDIALVIKILGNAPQSTYKMENSQEFQQASNIINTNPTDGLGS